MEKQKKWYKIMTHHRHDGGWVSIVLTIDPNNINASWHNAGLVKESYVSGIDAYTKAYEESLKNGWDV